MALTYNTQFEIDLRAAVERLRDDKKAELCNAAAVANYEEYRERVGFLRALGDVENLCDEVREELNKKR